MLLRPHCLEGIIDGTRKYPVLPEETQPQQKKEQSGYKMMPKLRASLHAR
jgi:hypothetical protein